MYTKELADKEVVGLDGWKIGKIRDTIFDPEGWKITSIEVELEGDVAEEFKMKKHFRSTHLPIDVSHVQAIGDTVTLKTNKEDLFKIGASSEHSTTADQEPTIQ